MKPHRTLQPASPIAAALGHRPFSPTIPRFALSRAALGIGPEKDLLALTADIRAANVTSVIGCDLQGRPTLLLDISRATPFFEPSERDRLILALQQQIEPIANSSGPAGFALLMLHEDFAWDMDIAWVAVAKVSPVAI